MKQVLVTIPVNKIVSYQCLQGHEILAYKSASDNPENYCILVQLTPENNFATNYKKWYGFVPVGQSNSTARYIKTSWHEAVQAAISGGRDVMMFDSVRDLLVAMLNKRF